MDLIATLKAGAFKPKLDGDSKAMVLEELVDLLMECDGVTDREAVMACILEREQKMSTGMQQGIAIPHGKTSAVEKLHVAVALKPDGVDFAALDGQPSQVFLITVSPANDSGPHIEFLGAVSKLLCRDDVRENVLKATTHEALLAAMDAPETVTP